MQGNCSTEPDAAALGLPRDPIVYISMSRQCVVVTDVMLLSPEHDLWLHNLYIRHHRTSRTDSTRRTGTQSVVGCFSQDCKLWMISVKLQGDDMQDP
jgi:hypothetical protein